MSTKTTTKTAATTKAMLAKETAKFNAALNSPKGKSVTASKPKTRKAAKPAVEDLRRWRKADGRKDGLVPWKTTATIGYDVRDALADYQAELGVANYDEVIRHMLIEAGYEISPDSPQRPGSKSA